MLRHHGSYGVSFTRTQPLRDDGPDARPIRSVSNSEHCEDCEGQTRKWRGLRSPGVFFDRIPRSGPQMDLAEDRTQVSNARKCLRNSGGPERTRISDLYRVKVAL
jgi:hypothetical protein